MSYAVSSKEESSEFNSLIDSRLQRIEELKKRLINELSMEDERELLRNLSHEMREVLHIQEEHFRSSGE
jgi:hypothetical protein